MKKLLIILFTVGFLGFTSCSFLGPAKQNTKNQDKLEKTVLKTDSTKIGLEKNIHEKLSQTATYAFGVQYSLNQVTNESLPVSTAIKLNSRIVSIVGSPELDEMNKITKIVDLLNSGIAAEKLKGEKMLADKDKEITELQNNNKELKTKYDGQIAEIISKSKSIAKEGDAAQSTINEMSGNFGLNAIWWGFKRFLLGSITAILIFVVLFLFLRIAAASNPIAASIFSVFNVIGSGVLQLVKGLTPRAVEISKLVNLEEHNKYKDTLDKIVDTIQTFKLKCEADHKQCTLNDVLEELDKEMDQKDKDCIEDVLKSQKWK